MPTARHARKPVDQLPQERAFARAHPELATLSISQIREAQAFAAGLERAAANERRRIEQLSAWMSDHGIHPLPLSD